VKIDFVKMHGLGNDFVVIDAISQDFSLSSEQIKKLSDRKLSIGFDQLLLVESAVSADVDFRYRIFNSDGSEVGQCGNGARCFAQFVRMKKLTDKNVIVVETMSGPLTLEVLNESDVTVDMGIPKFAPEEIPFIAEQTAECYPLDVEDEQVDISVVNIGNPHAVIFVDNVDVAKVTELGSKIETHPRFPERTNIQFVQIENRYTIRQRIFERGVGETAASGSGACAAVAVAQNRNLVDRIVEVQMPGGILKIERKKNNNSIFMTGPTEFSFEGSFYL
jgi:diaminopimelate epimerase